MSELDDSNDESHHKKPIFGEESEDKNKDDGRQKQRGEGRKMKHEDESSISEHERQLEIEDEIGAKIFEMNCQVNKEVEIHQVVTPCPIIYQNFTPNFLNTPHAMPFFMNYSFGNFEKDENLFLKN